MSEINDEAIIETFNEVMKKNSKKKLLCLMIADEEKNIINTITKYNCLHCAGLQIIESAEDSLLSHKCIGNETDRKNIN